MKETEGFLPSKKREYTLVILFFLLMTVIFTWPLVLHLHDGVVGGRGYGDPLLNSWIISWDAHTVFTNPTGLFQGNILYPSRDVLAYSEHLFTLGVMAAPVYYATHNPILAHNLLIFFGFIFSAFGCYLLIKELTGSRWGGLVGGIFFAFCPYKISQLYHLHIFFSPFLPFMMLYLYRYLNHGRRVNLSLFGFFFLIQSLASWHYLVICSLAAGLLWLWTAIFSRGREEWLKLAGVVIAVIIAALIILPFALPYLRARARLPEFERSLDEVEVFSAAPGDYLRVPDKSLVYGSAPAPFEKASVGSEVVLYPGIIILALALAGLLIRRREEDVAPVFDPLSFRRGALYFLILTAVGVLLTFGPEIGGVSDPLYTIPYRLGLFKFIRVPARFYILVALGLSVLAGYGTAKIAARISGWRKSWRAGRLAAAALVMLLVLELLTFNLTIYEVPVWGDVPEVYSWLEEQGEVKVIELPVSPLDSLGYKHDWDIVFTHRDIYEHHDRQGILAYLSTYHWKDTANGYSGYIPFFHRRILVEMQGFPSKRTVNLLRGLGVDYVIWHWNWVEEGEKADYEERLLSTPGLSPAREFEDITVFRVEAGDLAGPSDLAVSTAAPAAVPAEEGFNMALLVKNPSDAPLVVADEEPHAFKISFIDASGSMTYEEEGTYRTPFFLDEGGESFIPIEVDGVPPTGEYRLELSILDGIPQGSDFDLTISVKDHEDLLGTGSLDGAAILGEDLDLLVIPSPDGLYPLVFEAENYGEVLWRSGWEEEQEGGHYPFGLVFLGFRWEQEGGVIWGEQGRVLPSDVSPGQVMEAPVLVRVPGEAGRYRLFIRLADLDVGWFGRETLLEVEVR